MTFDLPIQQSRVVAHTGAPTPGHDPALVVAAQAGDREAFGALYERYGAMVHGVLLARVPVDAVDDLVQDVFLSAFQHLGSLRQPEAFGERADGRCRRHGRGAGPRSRAGAGMTARRGAGFRQ